MKNGLFTPAVDKHLDHLSGLRGDGRHILVRRKLDGHGKTCPSTFSEDLFSAHVLWQERLQLLDVLRSVAMAHEDGICGLDNDQVFDSTKGDQSSVA